MTIELDEVIKVIHDHTKRMIEELYKMIKVEEKEDAIEVEETKSIITFDQVKATATAYVIKFGGNKLTEVIATFNTTGLLSMKPEDYEPFYNRLKLEL